MAVRRYDQESRTRTRTFRYGSEIWPALSKNPETFHNRSVPRAEMPQEVLRNEVQCLLAGFRLSTCCTSFKILVKCYCLLAGLAE